MAMAPSASTVTLSVRPAARPRAAAVSAAAGSGRVRAGAEVAGGKWWAPLLGWSGRADYIDAPAPVVAAAASADTTENAGRRAFVGGLTEEKARELRARMVETESFHDAMYHSAIASRLARSA